MDSVVLTKVIEWVIELETDGLDYAAFVPEERRVRLYTLMWQGSCDGVHAQCSVGPPGGPLVKHKAML
jgi:hypothetical protein